MKYDNNQYYYSPSKNYPWYLDDNKPQDAIPMTVEMEEEYEAGTKQGFVIQPKPDKKGFVMVDPDSLLTPEELANRKIKGTKYELNSLIQKYERFTIPFQFNKLKPAQQEELRLFLEECDNLLKHVTVDTKIPEIPDFLKEPTEPLETN